MKSAIALVVFDIAGTTVKDRGEIAVAFQQALQEFGCTVPLADINPLMGYEKRQAIRKMLEAHGDGKKLANRESIEAIHQRFLERMVQYYRETQDLTPLPGVEDVFFALRQRNIRIALNTGFSKPIADVIVERLHWLNDKIDDVISSDEVPKGRPFPYMIQALMQRAGIADVSAVVKVGDTEVDIREGFNAGCRYSIGVTTGAFTREALLPYEPSFILDSPSELLPLIDKA